MNRYLSGVGDHFEVLKVSEGTCTVLYIYLYMCIYTQSAALIVHPRTAVRGSNGRDNRGPGRDNGGPPDAIIGVTLDAIMGPSQNYCKIHTDLATIKSQSGNHVPRYGRNQAAMCPHMGPTLSPPTLSPTHPPP